MEKKQNLTIDDIARELGVSKTTISRAISGKGRIGQGTRERILQYIEKTNYRPSAAAKGLAESKSYNIALVFPRSLFKMDSPFVRRSMTAICEEAYLHDYNILMCLSTDAYNEPLLRALDNRKVDGVILARTVEKDNIISMLMERGMPFATIGSLPEGLKGLATVEADHDQVGGCRAFAIEFLGASRESVAILGNDPHYMVNKSRLKGVNMALKTLGIPEEKVHLYTGLSSFSRCAEAAEDALAKGVRRFLAMDDDVCVHILSHFQEIGLIPGKDVSVASLYDNERLAKHEVPISALNFDASELGRVVCRNLLCYLQGEDYSPNPTLGYRIIMR